MPNMAGLDQETKVKAITALSKWKNNLCTVIQEADTALIDQYLILCVNSFVVRATAIFDTQN